MIADHFWYFSILSFKVIQRFHNIFLRLIVRNPNVLFTSVNFMSKNLLQALPFSSESEGESATSNRFSVLSESSWKHGNRYGYRRTGNFTNNKLLLIIIKVDIFLLIFLNLLFFQMRYTYRCEYIHEIFHYSRMTLNALLLSCICSK